MPFSPTTNDIASNMSQTSPQRPTAPRASTISLGSMRRVSVLCSGRHRNPSRPLDQTRDNDSEGETYVYNEYHQAERPRGGGGDDEPARPRSKPARKARRSTTSNTAVVASKAGHDAPGKRPSDAEDDEKERDPAGLRVPRRRAPRAPPDRTSLAARRPESDHDGSYACPMPTSNSCEDILVT